MKKLTAVWEHSQDISMERPRSIHWGDGSPATLDAYIEHSIDTRVLREDHPDRIELHIYPDVVGDVTYDVFSGSWVVKDAGLGGWSLDITDPGAKDDQLIAALSALPVVYRAHIRR
jgi:hypothetical protein